VRDEFLLGNDCLVAPVVDAGARSRTVLLPPGTWTDLEGRRFSGPAEIEAEAPLDTLIRFTREA
jgi:alpha-D-xyloside xylohydrolase